MKTYERILLIARPDMQRSAALRQAAALARETGAALHIAIFDHSAALDLVARLRAEDARGLREAFLRQRRDWLAQQAAELRATGIEVTTEAVWSRHEVDEILAHVVESGADLVVKDVDAHEGLRRVFMTALDWQLLRECPAPLLLVHGEQLTPRRLVAAVDVAGAPDDAFNEKILAHAMMLAYAFQAVPVVEGIAPMSFPAVGAELYDTLYRVHHDSFTAFADAHGVPAEQRHFLGGAPAPALHRFALQNHADVIVMGTTHRDRLDRVLLGSTAAAVLDGLPCSVLVVKPDALAAALVAQIRARLAEPPRQAA